MLYPTPNALAGAVEVAAEMARDKQDDDWSAYAGFNIAPVMPLFGGKLRWSVNANGCMTVGYYDSYEQASLVKAKLEYRRKAEQRDMIGLDGLAA